MKTYPLPHWKRAVIKVGSGLVAPEGYGCKTRALLPIARFITESLIAGKEVIVVSSGAVAAGLAQVHGAPPAYRRSIPEKQAFAAIGQTQLMNLWDRLLDVPCAQILLTHDDLRHRKRFLNAKSTLNELLKLNVLPVVNENDSVAVEELKVGDNDNLAAHVAVLAEADLLLILSDIDGLYDSNPHENQQARLLRRVERIDGDIYALAGGTRSSIATGGMITKIEAADKAVSRGINTVIANGKKGSTLERLLHGENPGTLFVSTTSPLKAKKHWMHHNLPSVGRILIDAPAGRALEEKGASLLPVGIVDAQGGFQRGDAVDLFVCGKEGDRQIGKGLALYSQDHLLRIKGRHSDEIGEILGFRYARVVVHRSDMVIFCNEADED